MDGNIIRVPFKPQKAWDGLKYSGNASDNRLGFGPESGRPAVEKTHLAKAQDEGVVADAQSYNFFRELWSERPFQSLA